MLNKSQHFSVHPNIKKEKSSEKGEVLSEYHPRVSKAGYKRLNRYGDTNGRHDSNVVNNTAASGQCPVKRCQKSYQDNHLFINLFIIYSLVYETTHTFLVLLPFAFFCILFWCWWDEISGFLNTFLAQEQDA